jgi:L-ribulose-5-phosphate 3-epimerase
MQTRVNRRSFLHMGLGAAATFASAPLAASLVTPSPPSPRRIKLSLKWGMVQAGSSVLEKFQMLKRLGYDGVEIDSPSDLKLDEVSAAIKDTGLVVPGVVDSVHWSQPLSSSDASVRAKGLDGLRSALRDAQRVGATTVLLVPAVVNASMSYEDAYRRSQEEIRKALPLAQELGVKIAIENVWNNFLLSPLEAARYIDEFESEHIGWYFDVGNIVNYGWPEQWIRVLGRRILKVDVKEFSRKKRDDEGLWKGFDVEIGEGDVDWKAVRSELRNIGYVGAGGWASAEVGGGDEARLKDILDRMNRVLNTPDPEN